MGKAVLKIGSFDEKQARWERERMVDGKRVRTRVSCKQLGLPKECWNEPLSRQAAAEYFLRLELAEKNTAEKTAETDAYNEARATAKANNDFEGMRQLVNAREAKLQVPTACTATLGTRLAEYVSIRNNQARAGARSVSDADSHKRHVGLFVDFLEKDNLVDVINGKKWEEFYNFLIGKIGEEVYTGHTADKIFGFARRFVKWLYKMEYLVALPRNLDDRELKFEKLEKEPPTFTNEEICCILKHSSERHRLLWMLMLNCGMTQKDCSDLLISQIDFASGRLTRARSKMSKNRNGKQETTKKSRVVSYKLWKPTLELLKKFVEKEGEIALRNENGNLWVWEELVGDTQRSSDNVASVFSHVKKRCGIEGEGKSLKVFRKTSSTRLANSGVAEYELREELFLGHKGKTVAAKHYSAVEMKKLDNAIDWLFSQYPLS